jgi:hypothetical protein
MNGRAASSLAPNHQMAKLSPPYRRAVFDRLQRLPLRNTGRRPLDLCELRHGLRELGTNLLSFCRTAELAIASSYLSNFPSLLPACRRGGVQMSVRPAQAATMTVALLGISWPATVENQGDNGSMRRVSRHSGVILPRRCPLSHSLHVPFHVHVSILLASQPSVPSAVRHFGHDCMRATAHASAGGNLPGIFPRLLPSACFGLP